MEIATFDCKVHVVLEEIESSCTTLEPVRSHSAMSPVSNGTGQVNLHTFVGGGG